MDFILVSIGPGRLGEFGLLRHGPIWFRLGTINPRVYELGFYVPTPVPANSMI